MGEEIGGSVVGLEIGEGLAVLTLNRPKAYNAFDLGLGDELLETAIRCDEDDAVRAVMITGEGRAFCSGGDVRQMQSEADAEGRAGRFLKMLTVRLHAVVATFARTPKPVVTAVNGPAAGAGFSLALMGDLVVAAEDASFTLAYTALAVLAAAGGVLVWSIDAATSARAPGTT